MALTTAERAALAADVQRLATQYQRVIDVRAAEYQRATDEAAEVRAKWEAAFDRLKAARAQPLPELGRGRMTGGG